MTTTKTITRLQQMPYSQAHIRNYPNGDRSLISYVTEVATIKDNWLKINGLYSATTRRHISAFMKELGYSYAVAKSIYLLNAKFNLITGEIVMGN